MSIELLNKTLLENWYVLDDRGTYFEFGSEEAATSAVSDWDETHPIHAPHQVIQFQVKGTLPEGAIMPEYLVGEKVMFENCKHIVTKVVCKYELADVYTQVRARDLSPVPPCDPIREEFETFWTANSFGFDFPQVLSKEEGYLIWQAAKAGAK